MHASCLHALTEAKLRGEQPLEKEIEREAAALRAANEAREALLTAIARASGD